MSVTSNEAKEIYRQFDAQSDLHVGHIATPITIGVLLRLAGEIHPSRILELGGGGGTLTYTLLKHTDAHVDVYEDLDFCRENLNRNCAQFLDRYTLLPTYDDLPPSRAYDIMIIDGPGTGEKGAVVERFIHHLKAVRFVYVEGHRYTQRLAAIRALASRYQVRRVRHESVAGMGTSKGGVLYEAVSDVSYFKKRAVFWYVYATEYLHWKTNIVLRRAKKFAATLRWKLSGRYHS